MTNYINIDETWGESVLTDWYCNSIDDSIPPVWTPEHIEELCNDFYIIPKKIPVVNLEKILQQYLHAADTKPIVYGYWMDVKPGLSSVKCSVCETCHEHDSKHCPECGAVMLSETEYQQRSKKNESIV